MTFGEKLKALRQAKDWTQPEASEAIGIEQSYLSKLENDKSIPSDEVFDQLLKGYGVTIHDLIGNLSDAESAKLGDIPAVNNYVAISKGRTQKRSERWGLAAIFCLVCGVGLVMSGQMALFFPNVQYDYAYNPQDYINKVREEGEDKKAEIADLFRMELITAEEAKYRIDRINNVNIMTPGPDFITTREYEGLHFIPEGNDDSKVYNLINERVIDVWHNKFLFMLGMMSLTSGICIIAIMRKWRS